MALTSYEICCTLEDALECANDEPLVSIQHFGLRKSLVAVEKRSLRFFSRNDILYLVLIVCIFTCVMVPVGENQHEHHRCTFVHEAPHKRHPKTCHHSHSIDGARDMTRMGSHTIQTNLCDPPQLLYLFLSLPGRPTSRLLPPEKRHQVPGKTTALTVTGSLYGHTLHLHQVLQEVSKNHRHDREAPRKCGKPKQQKKILLARCLSMIR